MLNDQEKQLIKACGEGDLSLVKGLLQEGVNVNAQDEKGYTPLFSAIIGGHVEIVKFLVENEADLKAEIEDTNAIDQVLLAIEVDKVLISYLDEQGFQDMVSDAAKKTGNHVEILNFLIDQGVTINRASSIDHIDDPELKQRLENLKNHAQKDSILDQVDNVETSLEHPSLSGEAHTFSDDAN